MPPNSIIKYTSSDSEIRKNHSPEPAIQTAPNFEVMHNHTRPSYYHRLDHLTPPCSHVTGDKVNLDTSEKEESTKDRLQPEPNSPENEYKVSRP